MALHLASRSLLTFAALTTFACGSDPEEASATGLCAAGAPVDDAGNLLITADPLNNYAFSSSVSVEVTKVQPNNSGISFDWSGVSRNLIQDPIDAMADIDMVTFILWDLTAEEMAQKLNADDLGASDAVAGGVAALYTENMLTSGSVADLVVPGGGEIPMDELMIRFDPSRFPPNEHVYTLMPTEGTVPGEGVQMVHAFQLDDTSTTTNISITSDSATISFDADLSSLTPVGVPIGRSDMTIDWFDMETNAMGREWTVRSIYEVLVAHYSIAPAEIETQFLDLESLADGLWRGEVVAGDSLTLSTLSDEAGNPFPGISDSGTWILALICGPCGNPAPWYLTRLESCD